MKYEWLEVAKKIQAISQAGLTYSNNQFDMERYAELRDISVDIMSRFTGLEMEEIRGLFANESGYQTPKISVRGVVFKDNKILLVREIKDGCWSLPGGWADIGFTPGEAAVKEVKEESGFDVKPLKVLAVLDRRCHSHSPSPYHVYKIFIQCEIVGGEGSPGPETSEVGFFDRDHLPALSAERVTEQQIKWMFEYLDNPFREVLFD
ncbi:MAG: NUDIX hydrolase [Clostridia bacterium]|nr:NUDIX hydrolase [Clostridia bacterium]